MIFTRNHARRLPLLTLALLTAPAASHAQYSILDLGVAATNNTAGSKPFAINNAGYITGYVNVTGGTHAFLINGNLANPGVGNPGADLGTTGGISSTGYGLNSGNVVVGNSTNALTGTPPLQGAYFNPAGHSVGSLGTGAQANSVLRGVNNFGVAVGASTNGTVPVYYKIGTTSGLISFAPALGNTPYATAYAINDNGVIAGFYGASASANQAFLYNTTTGTVNSLGTLGGARASGDGNGAGYGLNNNGHLVGFSANAANQLHGFYYNGIGTGQGSLKDLGTLTIGSVTGNVSGAYGINSFDDIVGYSNVSGTNYAVLSHAGGALINLNTLVSGTNPFSQLQFAFGVNDNGWIVGQGLVGGVQHGFLLKPTDAAVPEPGSVALLAGVGVSGLALLRRRARK